MDRTDFLLDGDRPGRPVLLLAHGAGAPMDTPFMTTIAEGLARRGLRVARFEFSYMAARRSGGPKRPPPRAELLAEEFHAALDALPHDPQRDGPLIIGGKSMGGRVASLVAEELHAAGRIDGLLCLGFPFHPQGKPDTLRCGHLAALTIPTLVCQGSRDAFGTRDEVAGYALSPAIRIAWFEDGDHDLKPRKRVTGMTQAAYLSAACDQGRDWAATLRRR